MMQIYRERDNNEIEAIIIRIGHAVIEGSGEVEITGIETDSRQVKAGICSFVCRAIR